MGSPLLYEINTRCWLNELSSLARRPVSLADVPSSEFELWRSAGFTHIWLMGVWTTGTKTRQAAQSSPHLINECSSLLMRGGSEDIGASPYAISGYWVSSELGGEEGLKVFRAALHGHGLKLILDFIPNHFGFDHSWLSERPELFVPGAMGRPGSFPVSIKQGTVWIAHGRDPNFPPWEDTAQLDYREEATRAAMAAELGAVAARCDGVRCDMAMLVLKKVFLKTWANAPRRGENWPEEFWTVAIRAVKERYPGFMFLAEVYWGLEPELRSLGFDYTYDKTLYDHILGDPSAAAHHLYGKTAVDLATGAYFLENHDEPRAAEVLSFEKHRVAALLLLCLPGLRLIHEGQLSGHKVHVPVQLLRRPVEPEDAAVSAMYTEILAVVKTSLVGQGTCRLLGFVACGEGTCDGLVLIEWRDEDVSDLVAINLGKNNLRCASKLSGGQPAQITELLSALPGGRYSLSGSDSIELEMPGYGYQMLRLLTPRR